jgi:glycine cleavage system H protein
MKYTADHQWLRSESDGSVTIGITHHAQDALGDLVFVELPPVGQHFAKDAVICTIESVKAAGEVRMPVAGTVIAANAALADAPEMANEDPEGAGWFIKATPDDPTAADSLLDEASYKALLGE